MASSSLKDVGSIAGMMFIWGTIQQFLPNILRLWYRLKNYLYPSVQINIPELINGKINESYRKVNTFLGTKSIKNDAKFLRVEEYQNNKSFAVTLDEGEVLVDEFQGAKIFWRSRKETFSDDAGRRNSRPIENRSYTITFEQRYIDIVTGMYLKHVMEIGQEIEFKNRKQKIYSNNSNDNWYWSSIFGLWKDINFEHPATFDTLAMDPTTLLLLAKGRKNILRLGRHGSAVIFFMVHQARERRRKRKRTRVSDDDKEEDSDSESDEDMEPGKLTLSGLLNFIDGIWSACGQERIIIFTTNHVEKLDPALIRRGRMDMHIEMSYCRYEAFKVLAKNYFEIETCHLYPKIKELLEQVDMSPCDVAEILLKNASEGPEICLTKLIEDLEEAKKEAEAKKKEAKKEEAKKEEAKKYSTKFKKLSEILVKPYGRLKEFASMIISY